MAIDDNAFKAMEFSIVRFYRALLPEVDSRAEALGLPKATEACGTVSAIDAVTSRMAAHMESGNYTDFLGLLESTLIELDASFDAMEFNELIALLGEHIDEAHSEYVPIFKEVAQLPSVTAPSDQMFAFVQELLRETGYLDNVN